MMGRCVCKGRLYLQTAMAQASPYTAQPSLFADTINDKDPES